MLFCCCCTLLLAQFLLSLIVYIAAHKACDLHMDVNIPHILYAQFDYIFWYGRNSVRCYQALYNYDIIGNQLIQFYCKIEQTH